MKKKKIKYITELTKSQLKGGVCLVRLELNVTNKEISKSNRIEQALKTIQYLSKKESKIVIIGHRGRPDLEKLNDIKYRNSLSLGKISRYLSRKLGKKILFIEKFDLDIINKEIESLRDGGIIMLENTRFVDGEMSQSVSLAKKYASFSDIYINDAFSVSHRNDVSVGIIPRLIPSYAGVHLRKEIEKLSIAIKNRKRPFVLIVGGAKISDKAHLINIFLKKANAIILGGGIANTYFVAQKIPVGDSLYEKSSLKIVSKWLDYKNIYVPKDVLIKDKSILDIGKTTIEEYTNIILSAKIIIWNGPMGYIENPKFSQGTYEIAKAVAKSKAYSVVGGGETTSFLCKNKLTSKFSFVSTGGGAMLAFLGGEKMPGIEALEKNDKSL